MLTNSSLETVRGLIRNLENTLHERLAVIEDVLRLSVADETNECCCNSKLKNNDNDLDGRITRLEKHHLHQRVVTLESMFGRLNSIQVEQLALSRRLDILHANMQLESAGMRAQPVISFSNVPPSDDRPVEAVEAEVEIETAEVAALDADIDASEVERGAAVALGVAVDALPSEEQEQEQEEEQEDEEQDDEEQEDEEQDDEEQDDEEQEDQEQEDEGVEVTLEEFTYGKKKYYRDPDNNVYCADEEGDIVDEIVGVWNPATKKIRRS